MLNKIIKSLLISLFAISLSYGEPIDLNGNVKGIDVTIKSANSLVVGNNDFFVTLKENGQNIEDALVKAKFFMPEMPGMPYMDYIGKGKFENGKYKMNINFSMNGTWQYQLKFKTSNGKKYKIRGSVNL
jgi:hypothetical protein